MKLCVLRARSAAHQPCPSLGEPRTGTTRGRGWRAGESWNTGFDTPLFAVRCGKAGCRLPPSDHNAVMNLTIVPKERQNGTGNGPDGHDFSAGSAVLPSST